MQCQQLLQKLFQIETCRCLLMSLFTQTKGLHLGKCFALFVCNSSSHSSFGSQWHHHAGSAAQTPLLAGDCHKPMTRWMRCQVDVWGLWCGAESRVSGACGVPPTGARPISMHGGMEAACGACLETPAKTGQTGDISPISIPGLWYFLMCSWQQTGISILQKRKWKPKGVYNLLRGSYQWLSSNITTSVMDYKPHAHLSIMKLIKLSLFSCCMGALVFYSRPTAPALNTHTRFYSFLTRILHAHCDLPIQASMSPSQWRPSQPLLHSLYYPKPSLNKLVFSPSNWFHRT